MDRNVSDSNQYRELVEVVARVRGRWRLKLAMRGLAILGVLLLVTFLASAYALGEFNFAPAVIITARVALAVVFLGALALLVLPPLWKRVTDEQVALYLEEREPSLKAALIGALAAGRSEGDISPALARRTIEMAVTRCRQIEAGRHLEKQSLHRSGGLLAGVVVTALIMAIVSPTFVRQSARALFLPLRTTLAEAADIMRVGVEPGDTAIARGADLPVTAELIGFGGRSAEVYARFEGDDQFIAFPMLPREGQSGFELRLFSVRSAGEYYVESEGIRSPVYRVEVLDLPYVDQLRIELDFPDYTGLENQVIEQGGDIFAPIGTRVIVNAVPTMPVTAATIAIDNGMVVPLTADTAGALNGEFAVTGGGLYHVELEAATSPMRVASPEYLIEIMEDAAPRVQFREPGRDIRVALTDEVYLEAEASDDFGIRRLELVYSINGGEEQTVPLYTAAPLTDVSAGHTFFLEELDLQAGDFISYYARAVDVGPDPREPVSSDMYFLEMRPFGVEYRQADSPPGGGGGGGGGGQQQQDDDQLSRRQRELISATFNVIRDRATFNAVEFEQNMEALTTAQDALRRQALTLAERLSNRGAVRDTTFDVIARELPLAAEQMEIAVESLADLDPDEALPFEQRALVHLQRAEAAFREVQVSLGQQGGAGGASGGATGPSAQDLADLFGLELDQLRNQYETLQQGQRQQASTEVDQTLDRVRELAQRLERQNEQLRQQMAQQMATGGQGAAQRQLAEEMLEEARRLERLSREQQRPELQQAAQDLREAAQQLQRAAASERSGNAAPAQEALERLREAQRRLERDQVDGLRNQTEDAAQRARRLAEQQREIARDVQNLPTSGSARTEEMRRLSDLKDEQANAVRDLQNDLERLANESRQEQPDASRRLRAAADQISRSNLAEQIRASRAYMAPNMPPEYSRRQESIIQEQLDAVREATEEASRSITNPSSEGERSLEQTRNLVRGLESMQERLRQGQQGLQPGQQQGQQGEGQQGQQPGQQGQGQQGQQGQQPGQQGQGQPGQQGQQPGQQGQGQQGQQPGQQGQGQQGQQPGQQGQGQQGQQGGQQGGQDEQGQPGGQQGGNVDGGGGGDYGNYWDGANLGYGGRYTPWYGDPDQVRQLRGELRQRIQEAEQLRRQLAEDGVPTGELDRAIQELRALDREDVFTDPTRLPLLQQAVLDRLKQFEFNLYQALRGDEIRRLFLSGNGEVPPEYRELVERYYREMSDRRTIE